MCVYPRMLQPGEVYTLTVGPFNKYPYTPNFFNVTGYRNGDLSVVPDGTLTGRASTVPRNAAPPRGTRFKYVRWQMYTWDTCGFGVGNLSPCYKN